MHRDDADANGSYQSRFAVLYTKYFDVEFIPVFFIIYRAKKKGAFVIMISVKKKKKRCHRLHRKAVICSGKQEDRRNCL